VGILQDADEDLPLVARLFDVGLFIGQKVKGKRRNIAEVTL
jgi:hypothetical protein